MLPDGWKETKLADVCQFLNGRAYKKEELLDSGKYTVLRVGNFFTNENWYYSNLELDEDKYCDNGDLLYAWSASFAPKIWNGGKVIYHYHIWKIVTDPKYVDKQYLYHFLEWDVNNIKSREGNGSTMIHVTKGAIEQRSFHLPPLEEQRRIAEVLSSVDGSIAAQSEVCRQTEITFNSLADAYFTAGDEAGGKVWPTYPLGDLCETIQVGIVVRPASYYVEAGGVPALRSLNVSENRLNLDDLVYISTEGHWLNKKSSLRPGDVVTRRTGEPGKTAVIPTSFPDGLNCIDIIFSRPKDNLRANFLSFFMNSDAAKRQVTGLQGGLAQQHLNVGEMKKLKVPVPARQIQDEVVVTLKSAWDRVEGEKALLDRLLSLRSAIGVDLISGRVRVPA